MCYDQEKTQAPINTGLRGGGELRAARESKYADCGTASRPMSDSEILAELFKYHSPNSETLPKYAAINQAAKNFAEVVLQNCPASADRSAAIRLIRDARMTANAAVALNGLSL
jgi:hypothetical protein